VSTISADQSRSTVKRRHVFFIPGYDPNAPRRYRELYRREAALQAEISGYQIDVSRIAEAPNFSWGARGQFDGAQIETVVELLTWQDIVRKSMSRTILATYLVMLRTVWIYISSGAFLRLVRLRWAPMLVALYPIVALIVQAIVAVLLGMLLHGALTAVGAPKLVALVAAAIAIFGVLELFRRIDGQLYVYYLIHDYGFNASLSGEIPHALRTRISSFASRMRSVANSGDVDEILVVGHSTGAQLAVIAVCEYLQSEREQEGPEFALLTLGQVIPMQSFLPKAQELRGDLQALSRSDALSWVDVSAPGDGGCFALSDPVAVSGVSPEDQKSPLIVSAAFKQTLSPTLYRETKWKFFRRHIQYLCAFDQVGTYDFFAITAGPMTLAERFAERAHSPSRITKPLSKYRDT
jgi:hypothetical protein